MSEVNREYYNPATHSQKVGERILGFYTERDRETLNQSTVAIAGVGGDGGRLAVELARMGVQNFNLADPEVFDVENLNRQEGSNYDTVGRNKAEVIAEEIKRIHPDANINVFTDGINQENITEFVSGVDVIADETEFTQIDLGVTIAREARKAGVPVFMGLNIEHAGQVTVYPPWGKTFEEHFGLDPDAPIEEIAKQEVDVKKWIHRLPMDTDMNVLKAVANEEISAPSVVTGVGAASGIMTSNMVDFLVAKGIEDPKERRNRLRGLPNISAARGRSRFMDMRTGESVTVRSSKLSLGYSALRATIRNKLGLTPKTHYSE